MVQRLDCVVSDGPAVMLRECGREIGGCPRDRPGQVTSEGQLRRDRCREGTAGPVDVGHGKSGTGKGDRFPLDPGVVSDLESLAEMPAFHQEIATVALMQLSRRAGECRRIRDRHPEERLRLGEVRGDETGEGKEHRLHLFEPVAIEQFRAGSGANDRIDDKRNSAVCLKKIRHDGNEVGIGKHSRFC
jgi:hypothetical protein